MVVVRVGRLHHIGGRVPDMLMLVQRLSCAHCVMDTASACGEHQCQEYRVTEVKRLKVTAEYMSVTYVIFNLEVMLTWGCLGDLQGTEIDHAAPGGRQCPCQAVATNIPGRGGGGYRSQGDSGLLCSITSTVAMAIKSSGLAA
jgi:hypothetical protein